MNLHFATEIYTFGFEFTYFGVKNIGNIQIFSTFPTESQFCKKYCENI